MAQILEYRCRHKNHHQDPTSSSRAQAAASHDQNLHQQRVLGLIPAWTRFTVDVFAVKCRDGVLVFTV